MKILVLTKRQYTSKDLLDDRFGRLRELPLELAKLGHEVIGICLSYRAREEELIKDSDAASGIHVTWHACSLRQSVLPGLIRYFQLAVKLLREFRPDVVLACSDCFHAIFGVWLAHRFKTKGVVDLYDNFESFGASRIPGLLPLFRRAVRAADGVTCVSWPLLDLTVTRYRRNQPTTVLENAVRPDLFYPREQRACRKQLGLPLEGKIIGTAGALSDNRGIGALFEGFELVAARERDCHLAIAGPRARRNRIPNDLRVHDLGILPFEKVPLLLNALNVAIICNRDSLFGRYSFPQKAYEIIACRIPLVAARVGSMKDLLTDHPECLFEPEDPESLAKVIRQQLAAPTVLSIDAPSWASQAQKLEAFLGRIKG